MENLDYFEVTGHISNSALKALKTSPKKFRRILEGEEVNGSTKSTELGTIIHLYLLERAKYDAEITVLDYEIPNSPAKKGFCESVFNGNSLLVAYRDNYSTKEKDEKVQEKAETLKEECKSYLDYLEKRQNKTIITSEISQQLQSIADNIRGHKLASKLIFNDADIFASDSLSTYCEKAIYWEYEKMKCKSLLDKLIIDKQDKVVIILDVKTTAEINSFDYNFFSRGYDDQLAFYTMACYFSEEFKTLVPEEEREQWDFKWYIIAIDTIANGIKVFEISSETIESSIKNIKELMSRAKYHIDNNLWDYSKEYYEGDGAEQLEKK